MKPAGWDEAEPMPYINIALLHFFQAPEGESQPMTEVDLFISTQRIKVLSADTQVLHLYIYILPVDLHTISDCFYQVILRL